MSQTALRRVSAGARERLSRSQGLHFYRKRDTPDVWYSMLLPAAEALSSVGVSDLGMALQAIDLRRAGLVSLRIRVLGSPLAALVSSPPLFRNHHRQVVQTLLLLSLRGYESPCSFLSLVSFVLFPCLSIGAGLLRTNHTHNHTIDTIDAFAWIDSSGSYRSHHGFPSNNSPGYLREL